MALGRNVMSFLSLNSFNVYLNVVAGLWMPNLSDIVPSFTARVALYALNILSDTSGILALISFAIHVFSPDVPIAERCIGAFITIITLQSVAKSFYFCANRNKFQRFIESWDKSLVGNSVTGEGLKLLEVERRRVKMISIFLLTVLASPSFIWSGSATIPALQELHGGRFMPIPGYFPYDSLCTPWYELTLAWEVAAGWFMMAKVVAFDTFFFTLATQEIAHLNQLKIQLEKMFDPTKYDDDTDTKNVPDLPDTNSETIFKNKRKPVRLQPLHRQLSLEVLSVAVAATNGTSEVLKDIPPIRSIVNLASYNSEQYHTNKDVEVLITRLKMWIKHHQEVIRFVAELNELYSPILLVQFFTSTLILCFSAFVAAEVDSLNVMQLVAVSGNTVSHLGHLLLLCRLGDQMAEASVSLSDAGLANGWQHCRVKEVLTSLKIIYHRTQIPLQISAVGVFPLSAETFVAITRAAISYLMVLIDIKKKT